MDRFGGDASAQDVCLAPHRPLVGLTSFGAHLEQTKGSDITDITSFFPRTQEQSSSKQRTLPNTSWNHSDYHVPEVGNLPHEVCTLDRQRRCSPTTEARHHLASLPPFVFRIDPLFFPLQAWSDCGGGINERRPSVGR